MQTGDERRIVLGALSARHDDRVGSELEPGKAAMIVLVRKMSADKVLPEIKVPGTVIQTSLSNEDESALQEALDAARS